MHLKTNETCLARNKMEDAGNLLSSSTATFNVWLEVAESASSSRPSCDVEATLPKADSYKH